MEPIYNPFLPLTEYIPDGEPHVFDGRLYLYGSHDEAQGTRYCPGDYVVWSAPVEDLTDWKCGGTIYRPTDDPLNADGSRDLYAPDVTRGPDGLYYLYYCFPTADVIGVAKSGSPGGPFRFYGHVNFLEWEPARKVNFFDPGVLTDDDGRVYLYFGFGDSYGVELMDDMLTVKGIPKRMIPAKDGAKGTGFENHAFYEASSMRKIGGRYYFIYSDEHSYNLCYATSAEPLGEFTYGGVLVSNGDVGAAGHKKPVNQIGNTHGSIAEAGGNYYVFYHRQTNGTEYSRQACAEELKLLADGSFEQAEITSCGLNGAGLVGTGVYPAAIACHLADRTMPEKIDYSDPACGGRVRVTQTNQQVYITGIKNRTKIGYKYFVFLDASILTLELRGNFSGKVNISFEEDGSAAIGEYEVQVNSNDWNLHVIPVTTLPGKHALYFYFKGQGVLEMKSLGFASV